MNTPNQAFAMFKLAACPEQKLVVHYIFSNTERSLKRSGALSIRLMLRPFMEAILD
jgi:hypothetical protein